MATVQDVLSRKGFEVHTIRSTLSVLEATQAMNDRRIGGMVVVDQGEIVGIFTERDVLRRVVACRRDPQLTYVAEVMTRDVLCVPPHTDLDQVSSIMKQKRVRHLPVTSNDGDLMGIISIGDVNAFYSTSQANHIEWLNEYVFGRA